MHFSLFNFFKMLYLSLYGFDVLLDKPDKLLLLFNSQIVTLKEVWKHADRQILDLIKMKEVFEVVGETCL